MGYVNSKDIAIFLNAELIGKNIKINNITSLQNCKKSSIAFSKKDKFDINVECLLLVPQTYSHIEENKFSVIKVDNPRLYFAKVIAEFFVEKTPNEIHKSSNVGNNCNIHSSVSIGMNCTIGKNVIIGKNTVINNNVVISNNTQIGSSCYVKSGSIIGEDGFGFDFEEDGTPIRLPHLGQVTIGNNVEIGACNTIARGTLDNTIISDNVKTDDQVHIAHNCNIGKNVIITACSEISGSVTVGANTWIGPNCSILQKVVIGDNVTIGIGSIVTKDIASNKKIMGLESLELRSLLKVKKKIEY